MSHGPLQKLVSSTFVVAKQHCVVLGDGGGLAASGVARQSRCAGAEHDAETACLEDQGVNNPAQVRSSPKSATTVSALRQRMIAE
jgi:hypothetical protein